MATQSLSSGAGLNQLSGLDRDFLKREFLDNRYAILTVAAFANRDGIPINEGASIKWPTISKAGDAQTLAEGGTATASDFTTGGVTASLVTYGDRTDWSRDLEDSGLLRVATPFAREFGRQHGQKIDTTSMAELDTSTNIIRPNARAADANVVAGDVIDAASIKTAILQMKLAEAPFLTQFINPNNGQDTTTGLPAYVCFVSPRTTVDLREITGFRGVEEYQSGNTVLPGEVGKFEECRFVETTNAILDADAGSGNVDVEHSIMIAEGALGMGSLEGRMFELNTVSARTVAHGNESGQVGFMSWTDRWVAKTIRSDHVRKIHHSASEGANA